MRSLSKVATSLVVSTLWSLALVSLIFPPHIFAQRSLSMSALAGLKAESHLVIEVLEMEKGDDMPTRFQVDAVGHSLVFELIEKDGMRGYLWNDQNDKSNSGFRPLPDLQDVLSWKIERDDAGFFQAEMPATQLGHTLDEEGKLEGPIQQARPKIDAFGFYDSAARSYELTAMLEDAGAMDISVSLAQLDESFFAGEDGKAFTVAVSIGTILAILGLVVLTCAVLFAFASFVCTRICNWGVLSANASCVPKLSLTCTCQSPPPPPQPCDTGVGDVIVMPFEGVGKSQLAGEEIRLARLEASGMKHDGEAMSYLMAEWAVVSYAADGSTELLRNSSSAFDQAKADSYGAGLAASAPAGGGRQTALLLAVPPHDENSRAIPTPDLLFSGEAGSQEGKVLVRADFSEDRRLQGFSVLADTLGGVSPELARSLEEGLSMSYKSDQQHRAISFALISVGENPRIEIVQTYTPKCCCGDHFCV